MSTPTTDVDSREPGTVVPAEQAHDVCGYRWTGAVPCEAGADHECWRTSSEHRSHLCTCEAVELLTARAPQSTTAATEMVKRARTEL